MMCVAVCCLAVQLVGLLAGQSTGSCHVSNGVQRGSRVFRGRQAAVMFSTWALPDTRGAQCCAHAVQMAKKKGDARAPLPEAHVCDPGVYTLVAVM
jgi:hypothetical protein